MKYRLKDNHPTMEKLNKLIDYAESLGISLSYFSESCIVSDSDYPDKFFKLEDLETNNNHEFPPVCEFKLTYKK